MKLRIGKSLIKRWKVDLVEAGNYEIGGILFGEQVDDSEFILLDITTQKNSRFCDSFVRDADEARRSICKFNEKYNHSYSKYNYLGEWHSHPNFTVLPSTKDKATMRMLLQHPDNKANFLLLIIIRINKLHSLEIGAKAYLSSGHVRDCSVLHFNDLGSKEYQ
ncbi:MAG: Mov34/MPN/PAD-1 family protein [Candidatus Thiodiazotropha endolucinida]